MTIRVATKWYRDHLAANGSKTGVVLLTDDVANKTKAREMGLKAASEKVNLKRTPAMPRERNFIFTKKNVPTTVGAVPFDTLV